MAQKIKQGNIFGRVGTGIGKGLAEQLPKEVERSRLASGLEQLSQQQDLTPFQQFSALASTPGVTPQIIQSGAELLRQQGIAQGFRNVRDQNAQPQPNPFREAISQQNIPSSPQSSPGLQPTPSGLVNPKNTEAALKPYIPMNLQQLNARAAELYDQNRQLYPNPESALKAAQLEDQQNQSISNAGQAARASQIGVENRATEQLKGLRAAAGVAIPDNVYQQVENDVLDKIRAGEGETQAAKYGQKEMDKISRDYNNLAGIGNWTIPFKNVKDTRRSIESLRQKFEERNDLENFADTLVGKNGLSYPKAYYLAYPPNKSPQIHSIIEKLPELKTYEFTKGYPSSPTDENAKKTLEVAKKIAPLIKSSEASPLAISEALRTKNYDPNVFLDHLVDNKKKYDFTERQARELDKTRNWFPSLNDLWIMIGAGLDRLVE